jgi:hypothetical protein
MVFVNSSPLNEYPSPPTATDNGPLKNGHFNFPTATRILTIPKRRIRTRRDHYLPETFQISQFFPDSGQLLYKPAASFRGFSVSTAN